TPSIGGSLDHSSKRQLVGFRGLGQLLGPLFQLPEQRLVVLPECLQVYGLGECGKLDLVGFLQSLHPFAVLLQLLVGLCCVSPQRRFLLQLGVGKSTCHTRFRQFPVARFFRVLQRQQVQVLLLGQVLILDGHLEDLGRQSPFRQRDAPPSQL